MPAVSIVAIAGERLDHTPPLCALLKLNVSCIQTTLLPVILLIAGSGATEITLVAVDAQPLVPEMIYFMVSIPGDTGVTLPWLSIPLF
jgi:hypothetical protein